MNTWQRNPQELADEHDWVYWFADPNGFRDVRWDVQLDGLEFTAVPSMGRQHG